MPGVRLMPEIGARHPGGLALAYLRADGEGGLQLAVKPASGPARGPAAGPESREESGQVLWKPLTVREAADWAARLSDWVAMSLREQARAAGALK